MWLMQRQSACELMCAGTSAWRAQYRTLGIRCLDALQVRAVVEGRASAWQKHLTLTPTKPGASEAVRPCHIHCSHICMSLCHRPLTCCGVHVKEDSTSSDVLLSEVSISAPCLAVGRGAGGGGGSAHLRGPAGGRAGGGGRAAGAEHAGRQRRARLHAAHSDAGAAGPGALALRLCALHTRRAPAICPGHCSCRLRSD